PTPKVEWQKTDGDLKTTSASLNNSARWLHFKSITEDDDGEYKCRAHNVHGNATPVFHSPPPTSFPHCVNVCAAVDEDSRRTVTSSALILRDVVLSDTAVYQCEATNEHGSILQNINLFVVGTDRFCSHHSVAHTCHIKILCHNDTRDDMVPLLSDPRVSLFTNGTIEIVNVTHEDHGVYTCSVDNTNISITANLEVFDKTVILKGPQDIHVLRGQAVFLDCHFYKDSRLHGYKVHWKKDNLDLRMLDK
ncbi:hypothetical protein XENOCAPTIV_009174, partial [Xenoophorus captivus]